MAAIRTFGWDAVKLSQYSLADLNALRLSVESDPNNRNPDGGSLYIHSKSARRKLDALAWAVTYRMAEDRATALKSEGAGL